MKEIYVTPTAGLVVVDPATMTDLPSEGRKVADSQYWRRRHRDGAVKITDKAPKTAAKSSKQSPEA